MRLDYSVRRTRRISMTSLIDVIFLLLLFFMLSSTFTRFAEVELSPSGGAGTSVNTPDIIVNLEDGAWRINGAEMPASQIDGQLLSLRESGAATTLVLIGEGTLSQDLVTALETIRRAGLDASVAR